MSTIIYVASPYTHNDPQVRAVRFDLAQRWLAHTFAKIEFGYVRYSPIVHWHPTASAYSLGISADIFAAHSKAMLSAADILEILCLPGWDTSKGIDMEIKWAEEFNHPISYVYYNEEEQRFHR